MIIDILSNSIRKFDKTLKRLVYQNMPSFHEYVLIEQDRVENEGMREFMAKQIEI